MSDTTLDLLRQSENYIWFSNSILGKGATATVYQGVNKNDGTLVAVKTFNNNFKSRPLEEQLRKLQVFRKVNHDNIVKLLAVEEEQGNRGMVLVMELCTGGSLSDVLVDPENTYGLEESEFLLVLAHLFAGMKYLRDNNIVHRDLKPGNIVKFIKDDGTTVYKLTDFGAARELQDGQDFLSLYGTEEYLHPDMYERALLRQDAKKTFGATIDLWSIGVTLYHVATGNLPFKPYGGRRNKRTMHHITTKKDSGVISGIQTKEYGPIEWKRELPVNCQLSAGLKKIVTPLLAGLLEADTERIWSFEKFFKEVDAVLSRKAVNIFHVNKSSLIKVYIDPKEFYQNLQKYIVEQTGITPENQILLYKSSLLTDLVEEYAHASGFPPTAEDDPIFLFSKEINDVNISPFQDLPKFNDFSKDISVENDASKAKFACSIGHQARRQIEKYCLYSKLICDTVDYFTKFIIANLKNLYTKSQHLLDKTQILKETVQILEASKKISNYSGKSDNVDNLNSINMNFSEAVESLYKQHVIENDLKLDWEKKTGKLKTFIKNDSLAPARARTQIEHLRSSWQHLLRNTAATPTLSRTDEVLHLLERRKITKAIYCLKNLLEHEVFPQYEAFSINFGDWYKMAQVVHLKTEILAIDVNRYDSKIREFENNLTEDGLKFREYINSRSEAAQNKIKNFLKNCEKKSNKVREIISENSALIDALKQSIDELQQKLKQEKFQPLEE